MPKVAETQLLLPPYPMPHPGGPRAVVPLFWMTNANPSAGMVDVLPPNWKANVVEKAVVTFCAVEYQAELAQPPAAGVRRNTFETDCWAVKGAPKVGKAEDVTPFWAPFGDRQPWFALKSGEKVGAEGHCADTSVAEVITLAPATRATRSALHIAIVDILLLGPISRPL
jgi:hypothetical protein